ncbi:hypothetical protein SPWS13_4182 [Shewanella putrefaciens]|nr:hypothetical protein SPWS13_4182 [Shewanella putrefaciens]
MLFPNKSLVRLFNAHLGCFLSFILQIQLIFIRLLCFLNQMDTDVYYSFVPINPGF